MQIDTYVVKIQPNFDISAFTKVKKKIETLKSPVKVPIEVVFNNSSLRGLKTKIQNEVAKNNIKLKLPVEPMLTGKSLKDFKNSLSFKPIQIPAVLKFDKDSLDIIKQLWSQAGLNNSNTKRKNRNKYKNISDDDAEKLLVDELYKKLKAGAKIAASPITGLGGAVARTGRLATRIGEYGLGGALTYGAAKMVASPFVIEDNLYKIRANEDYKSADAEKMKDVIIEIGNEFPIMASAVSDVALAAARANVSLEDLFGVASNAKEDIYNAKKSQLYLYTKLAAYTDEDPENTFQLVKQLHQAFPKIEMKKLGDYIAGAADLTHWNFGQMQSFISAAGTNMPKNANMDIETLLGMMSIQSLNWKTASDAGTSLKTFGSFTANAKSDKSQASMAKYGLTRWNSKGTALENFRTYLIEINNLYKEFDKNNGIIERMVTKTVGKGKNKRTVTQKEQITREQFSSDMYNITGSDAKRLAEMLSMQDLEKVLKDFDNILLNADLDKKMVIRSQSALYKLQLLFSQIETGFVEAFDTQTITNVGNLFKDIGEKVALIANYLSQIGGLSGIWRKFMDSEFLAYLKEAANIIKRISLFFGYDIDANVKKAQIANYQAYASKESTLQNPAFRTPIINGINGTKQTAVKNQIDVNIDKVNYTPSGLGYMIGKKINDKFRSLTNSTEDFSDYDYNGY